MMKNSQERRGERGSALVLVLLVTMLLFVLGMALLATSETEATIAANDHWAEAAFQAADAAVQVAIDQLDPTVPDQVVPETQLGDEFVFRSGGRESTEPQPPELMRTAPAQGYALGDTSAYDPTGYVFAIYRINGTGTGPRNSEREVEVEVEYGPVAE